MRQDVLIAEGLLAPYEDSERDERVLDMALARIRQLSAHEIGIRWACPQLCGERGGPRLRDGLPRTARSPRRRRAHRSLGRLRAGLWGLG